MQQVPLEWTSVHDRPCAPVSRIDLDVRGYCIRVDPAACELLASHPEALLGQAFSEAGPGVATSPAFRSALAASLGDHQPRFLELPLAGGERWLEVVICPHADGFTLLLQDISKQRSEQVRLCSDQRMLNQAQELAHVGGWSWDVPGNQVHWSSELYRIYGVESARQPATFEGYLERVHPDDRQRVQACIQDALRQACPFAFEERICRPDGEVRVLASRGLVETDGRGEVLRMMGACLDITEVRAEQRFSEGQHDILRGIAARQPLPDSLRRIALLHESLNPGALCSVLIHDAARKCVLHGAAPSLPETYNRQIHGLAIGPEHGSCGTAIFRGERVVVADIAHHPYWAAYRDAALASGLRACWSTPILGRDGKVLGSFAVYYRQVREPTATELAAIDRMLPLAAMAMESDRLLERLRVRNHFFEKAQEVFCVLDPRTERLEQFNPFLESVSGFSTEELLGDSYRRFLFPLPEAPTQEVVPRHVQAGQICEFVNRCVARDGRETLLEWTAWPTANGLLYAVARDVTARRKAERALIHAASHDGITRLPRRHLREQALDEMLRESDVPAWVLMVGLDRFQVVNESVGHVIGDDVLRRVATRLLSSLGPGWLLARLSGDRFAAAAQGFLQGEVLEQVERMRRDIAAPIEGDDYRLLLTASVGISHSPDHGRHADSLMRGAEAALVRAKHDGRDRVAEFDVAEQQALEERVRLGSRLRDAVVREQLQLHYQPQVAARGRSLIGFEALLRWNNPQLGQVMPGRFIPLAEALGLMPELGHWVLAEAARQIRDWLQAGYRGFTLAVNVSAQQMHRPEMVDLVAEGIHEHDLPVGVLELEMTESALMENVPLVRSTLAGLKRLGVRLALDDFGTGYSSLAYLKQFPIDKLKIDQGFVRELPDNVGDGAIVQTIIALGHQLNMQVSAEGVETPAQAEFLDRLGCDELQGYHFGRPQPAGDAQGFFTAAETPVQA